MIGKKSVRILKRQSFTGWVENQTNSLKTRERLV